jgi:ankyrin repeat protein
VVTEAEKRAIEGCSNPRSKAELSAFFKQLDKIKSFEDDDSAYENDPEEIVNNDSDGVACLLASDLETVQKDKISKLLEANEVIFPPTGEDSAPIVIDNGDDINKRGKYGYTQLTVAVLARDLDAVKALVAKGASWEVPDNNGQTAWDKAYMRGFDEIIRVFDPSFVRPADSQILDLD